MNLDLGVGFLPHAIKRRRAFSSNGKMADSSFCAIIFEFFFFLVCLTFVNKHKHTLYFFFFFGSAQCTFVDTTNQMV